MVFVIDIGNTNVSFAGVDGEQILFHQELESNSLWTAEDYARKVLPILGDPERFRGAILSSVVPGLTETVRQSVAMVMGREPLVVTPETETGLTIDLPEPDKVGRDRLMDAAWAAEHFPLPCVTADLGTASTFNVILPGKIFAGGIICAGIQTGLKALAQRTAQLPALELEVPERIIGKNTVQCMLSGAVAGTAAMVDGLVLDIEQELGQPVSLVLTGGGGKYVSPLLRREHTLDPDMILKGLALVYEKNC